MKRWLFALYTMLSAAAVANGQKIVYSEYERDDTRRMNFEIIGKVNGNYLVYKNVRNKNWIVVFDNDMNQLNKVQQEYMPSDRLINVDFFTYPNFSYMIYQYQRKNVVYCNAVRIGADGRPISSVMELDTSHISFTANNKIYSVITSEDKRKIALFKINTRNRNWYVITTMLMNDSLELQKRSVLGMPMEERNDHLDEFYLDNEGDLVFTKFYRNANDNIGRAALVIKPAAADSFFVRDLEIDKTYLDELHIKVDNHNKRYFLTSFFYRQRRGNIDGFYFYVWDKASATPLMQDTVTFSQALREEARGNAGTRTAFNDFFIRNIITRRDGGFIIGSESFYTSSRGGSWNRWDYLFGNPFYSPMDYYSYSPYYNNWWWRSRYGNNQAVRYHADNIVLLSFDRTGRLEWSNVISKEQFDDEGGDLVSYQLVNTGDQLHILFNNLEKRAQLLNDYAINPSGAINRNPTLKNLDRGFEFMPKYGKQVSAKQIIIPCLYRNYICFAKIDYN